MVFDRRVQAVEPPTWDIIAPPSTHSEALVEAGEEVSEHAVSVIDGCCLRESQFGYEPVLEGAGHTLNPPLGLR